MQEPAWVMTAARDAMITRDELLEWMRISRVELRNLIDSQGFPLPRCVGLAKNGFNRLTPHTRWRVGDVRAWLSGDPEKLKRSLNEKTGQERPIQKATPLFSKVSCESRRHITGAVKESHQ